MKAPVDVYSTGASFVWMMSHQERVSTMSENALDYNNDNNGTSPEVPRPAVKRVSVKTEAPNDDNVVQLKPATSPAPAAETEPEEAPVEEDQMPTVTEVTDENKSHTLRNILIAGGVIVVVGGVTYLVVQNPTLLAKAGPLLAEGKVIVEGGLTFAAIHQGALQVAGKFVRTVLVFASINTAFAWLSRAAEGRRTSLGDFLKIVGRAVVQSIPLAAVLTGISLAPAPLAVAGTLLVLGGLLANVVRKDPEAVQAFKDAYNGTSATTDEATA